MLLLSPLNSNKIQFACFSSVLHFDAFILHANLALNNTSVERELCPRMNTFLSNLEY